MKKKYTVILTIIFMILAGAFELFQGTVAITPSEDLKVHFLDVGQGDSIFIELPTNETILIDASIKDASNKLINYLREENVSKIDYVFATHPHSDHIGGMSAVIKAFDIGQIYMPKAVTTTKTYENLLLTIKDKNLKIKAAKAGNTIIDTDDLKLVINKFKGIACLHSNYFKTCNLNRNNYTNLKWEDEPVEVFINMENWIWTSGIANIVGDGRKQLPSLIKAIVSIIEIPQKKQPIAPIITTVKMGTKRMVHLMSGLTNIQKFK